MAPRARYVVRTVGELLYWLAQINPSTPISTADDRTVVVDIIEVEDSRTVIITDEIE